MADSSSSNTYDAHRFLSLFNQEMFEEFVRSKDIILEKSFGLKDEEYPEIRNQITLRGWKRQANPNLVQIPLHDLTKMVYDNLENKRPMFRGALKTDPNPGQVSRPEPIPPEDLHLYNNQQARD
ncbi:hypothetical protein PIB30_100217 [Stylosanthes scabra]|uniref:Uncharacterized protein n=1 Tax=Stylosanthes scabra TaxID=79078 RepID=A0ABU6ZW69_9FABA|nr:hypothetical protein [Stylosanthes scabra]